MMPLFQQGSQSYQQIKKYENYANLNILVSYTVSLKIYKSFLKESPPNCRLWVRYKTMKYSKNVLRCSLLNTCWCEWKREYFISLEASFYLEKGQKTCASMWTQCKALSLKGSHLWLWETRRGRKRGQASQLVGIWNRKILESKDLY